MNSPFQVALDNAIRKAARSCRGLDAITFNQLLHKITPPSSSLDGAPRGTNAQWVYAQMVRDAVQKPGMGLGNIQIEGI